MARPRGIPSYRFHKGSNQAVVVIDGRSHYLGPMDSPASRRKYDRLIAEWLAAGRSKTPAPAAPAPATITVAEVVLAFADHARDHYRLPDGTPSEEIGNLKAAIRPVRQLYGSTPAAEFGPLALRAVREQMVAAGLARTSINARVDRIRRMFRWAASVELIPVAVVQALETVAGLQAGRSAAREPDPVGPVAPEVVERTLPHLSRPVAGLVRLQLLTGMRPGEACAIRGADIVRGEPNWTYEPARHKNAWRGKRRVVPLGPQARALLEGFLDDDPAAPLFRPSMAVAEHHAARTAARRSKPTPSERARRAAAPGSMHADRYKRNTYLNAIGRACDRAFPHPNISAIRKSRRTPEQAAELEAWRKAHRWHPNQLRHTAATLIRAEFGLEAAQVVLGHARADTTQIYAERDLAKAHEVIGEIG